MMFLDELYQKNVAENEKYLKFWENYLAELKFLNFNVYAEKLKVPILVPIGNRILFRGELKHTNEITVAMGADYFVKCSTAQAEVLRQHRIKFAQSKVDLYKKEKEYLESQISFTKENVSQQPGHEILEKYSEEEDKIWRDNHRKNVKKYKQSLAKENKPKDEVTDAELWERLEVLELEEELENELLDNYNEIVDRRKENTFLEKEEAYLRNNSKEEKKKHKSKNKKNKQQKNVEHKIVENKIKEVSEEKSNSKEETPTEIVSHEHSEYDLLRTLFTKHLEFENKMQELTIKENKVQLDLIAQLDTMEQLDDLEDEIERLDDILQTENVDTDDEDEDKSVSGNLKKSISFADEDDSETLEIEFAHSDITPNTDQFDPKKGITKPSDLYEAFSPLFNSKKTSILKKSKYESDEETMKPAINKTGQLMFQTSTQTHEGQEPEETPVDKTIVINDVVENVGVNQHKIQGGARPTSLFKKKRMQRK